MSEEEEKMAPSAGPSINPIEGLKALSEASTSSLDEFFSKDPLLLQDREIDQIVDEYRKMRGRWAMAEAAGKKTLPKAAIPKALQAAPKAKLSETEF